MRLLCLVVLSLLLPRLSLASPVLPREKITPDVATQRVLKKYGVDSKLLRSFDELEDVSRRADGRFELLLAGAPELYLLLDRDYWVLTLWDAKKELKRSSYILNPKDEQSALNITVEDPTTKWSGLDRSSDPGFSGYTARDGVLAGIQVSWRRCSDANHLYSEASVTLAPVGGNRESKYTVIINITANSEPRRRALEDSLADLKLRNAAVEKKEPESDRGTK